MSNTNFGANYPNQFRRIFGSLKNTKQQPVFNRDPSGGGGHYAGGGRNDDDLRNIKFHEVNLAKEIITPQLFLDVCLTEIRESFICNLELDSSLDICPPQIFGRVINIYPDGNDNIYNKPIELVSMRVPRKSKPSSIIDIPARIIKNYPMPASWYFRLPVWAAPSDISDLEGFIEDFWTLGVYLDIRTDPWELQDLNSLASEHVIPWIIIVTSDWLSAQSPEAYNVFYSNLKILLFEHGSSIINYHPRGGIILNEVAGYVSRRSKKYFIDSFSVPSLLKIVDDEFTSFLDRPLNTFLL